MLETPAPIDPGLDVIHRAAGGLLLAGEAVGDRCLLEYRARRGRRIGENIVAVCAERAVEQLDDFEHRDLIGSPRERVATLDAALRAEHATTAQRCDELLQELGWNFAAAGDLADRNWLIGRARQLC